MPADWRTRTKEAAYTGPSGTLRQKFVYTDLSQEVEKKTTVFEFPESLGTYVQDMGVTGRRCPMVCYFTGGDCDYKADTFMEALSETGAGVLEHPVYGPITVTPVGTIKREDPRASGGNVVTITVNFVETIALAYPNVEQSASDGITVGASQWYAGSAIYFDKQAKLETAKVRRSFADKVNDALNDLEEFLKPMYDTFEDIQKGYDAISGSITRGLDILIGQPATLMAQVSILIDAPSRLLSSLKAQLEGYVNVIDTTLNGQPESDNDYLFDNVVAGSSMASICKSAVSGTFGTQEEAIAYANTLATKFDEYTEWRDTQFRDRGLVDDPDSYRALQDTVALTIGNIITTSFTLSRRFEITLDRDRNIVELETELYGTVDQNMDFMIDSNNLVGKELIIIPKGREVVYYV